MNEYTGYIYSITNEINGKSYIGKTNDLVRRWKEHCYSHGGTAILDKAFKKYGLEHFVFDIVAQIPFDNIEELNDVLAQLEMYYIELYDTYHNGYNATMGGDGISGYKQSPETTEKIRQANLGRVLTEEHKAKCRIANLGNHHTEKAKEAIRQALLHRDHSIYERAAEKRRGVKRNHEMIMKAAEKRRKPILQYDLEGNFIKEWEGISCVKGFERTNIGACCRGKILRSQGYIWRYKEGDYYPRKIEVSKTPSRMKKVVIECDVCNNIIREYPSINKAAKAIGINSNVLRKHLKKGGYIFENTVWKLKKERR